MSNLTLYGERYWFSPFVFSAYVALVEKGLAFDERTFDLFGAKDHLDPEFQRSSITGKVPALVHDGFWLGESAAIVEYIEESFPSVGPLFPADRAERARARQVMGFLRSAVEPLREERPTHTMFYPHASMPLSPEGQKCAERLVAVSERLIGSGAPTIGSRWSIADAELSFMLHRLILNDDPVPPVVAAYAKAQWERPSAARFVNHPRPAHFATPR
jgi:glutathione S-transferase